MSGSQVDCCLLKSRTRHAVKFSSHSRARQDSTSSEATVSHPTIETERNMTDDRSRLVRRLRCGRDLNRLCCRSCGRRGPVTRYSIYAAASVTSSIISGRARHPLISYSRHARTHAQTHSRSGDSSPLLARVRVCVVLPLNFQFTASVYPTS